MHSTNARPITLYLAPGETGNFWVNRQVSGDNQFELHTLQLNDVVANAINVTFSGPYMSGTGWTTGGDLYATAADALNGGPTPEVCRPILTINPVAPSSTSSGDGGTLTDLAFDVDEETDAGALIDQEYDDIPEEPMVDPLSYPDIPFFAPITLKTLDYQSEVKPYQRFINLDASWWRDNPWSITLGVVATGFATWYGGIIIWRELKK